MSRTLGPLKLCGGFGRRRAVMQGLSSSVAPDMLGWSAPGFVRMFIWRKRLPADNRFIKGPRWGCPSSGKKKGPSLRLTPRYLWWSWRGSNSRPLECHSSALPAELQPHTFGLRLRSNFLTCMLKCCQYIFLDICGPRHNNQRRAGVVKLVDAGDSKSPFPRGSVGSIPTSGTKIHPYR